MTPSTDNKRLHAIAAIILACVPFAALIIMVCRYNVDVPHIDQWALVPLLEKSYGGTLAFSDLWAQHNEHRLIFPRIIMLCMAHLSDWNIFCEYAVSVVCAMALLVITVTCLRLAEKRTGATKSYWLIPVFSLLIFSPSQWQNWYLGWQFQIFLNLVAFIIGIHLLAKAPFKWPSFIAAILCGIISTFSFANGLVFWIIGALILIVFYSDKEIDDVTRKRNHVLIWGLISGIIIVAYLHNYKTPPMNSALQYALTHPLKYAAYICKYLGGAIVYVRITTPLSRSWHNYAALLIGAVGLLSYVMVCRNLIVHHKLKLQSLAPIVAIALYALASAMLAGQGRLGHGGSGQALSPRYVTIANLFWISLLILLHIQTSLKSNSRPIYMKALMAIMACLLCISARYGQISWAERHDYLQEARTALITGEDGETMKRLFRENDKPHIDQLRDTLKQLHLSVFRNQDK